MASRLLTDGIWGEITRLAQSASSAKVAVAYFGQGASRLLPLNTGGVLVVNLSMASVRSGQTCPQEVARLIRRGVEVHNCGNLHAKVFVFGRRAIIGSNNVSQNSHQSLIEAAVETTDADAVRSCKDFIDSLRGDHVDLDYALRLAKFYKPPRIGRPARSATPRHEPFWVVPLGLVFWKPEDQREAEKSEPAAAKKLKDQRRFRLERFSWYGGGFRRPLTFGELLMQVTRETPERTMLSPVARVIHIHRYGSSEEQKMIVYLRTPALRRKNLRDVEDRLGDAGDMLRSLKASARLIRTPKTTR
jgi:hypothetical protein